MEPIFDKLFQFTYNQGWRYSRCGTGMQLERPGGCYPRELPEHGTPTAKDNRCVAGNQSEICSRRTRAVLYLQVKKTNI